MVSAETRAKAASLARTQGQRRPISVLGNALGEEPFVFTAGPGVGALAVPASQCDGSTSRQAKPGRSAAVPPGNLDEPR